MQNKVKGKIHELIINAPTYNNVSITPSMINFFYGKNGTGKSTLAKAFIKDENSLLRWNGEEIPEERILVYNEEFIEKNVQSYGNIPGVFTISEVNAEKKKEVDAKIVEKNELDRRISAVENEITQIEADHVKERDDFNTAVWDKTASIRNKLPKTQDGFKTRKNFSDKILSTFPSSVTFDECEKLYHAVYDVDNPRYDEYREIKTIPISSLMETSIVSRADTNFALFIRALGNLDWITAGHKSYHNKSDGKCPYCQQQLPPGFEESLALCYDEEYKKDLQELTRFIDTYSQMMISLENTIGLNLQNQFPSKLKDDYKKQAQLLIGAIKHNKDLLSKKRNSPSESIELEDLSILAADINTTASTINKEIKSYMAIFEDIPTQKIKCMEMVWSMLAKMCEDRIEIWKNDTAKYDKELSDKQTLAQKLKEQSRVLDAEIVQLNSQTVNTTKAMDDINRLIASAGFTGFKLKEKPGAKYVYQLVREENGRVSVVNKSLSEGERHFIAFLYFYHIVMGSQADDGRQLDKIVVVDDPVSSLDSSSLFVVASLTRKMIEVCYNNFDMTHDDSDKHILQFFCMTHNPYFFREVSFNHLSDYQCCTFYEIKKNELNQTSINVCEEVEPFSDGEKRNISPVKNTYDALWYEYKHTENSETLMIIIRQILEYYFVQMVGFPNDELRRRLFKDGNFSKEDYISASAMISMIDVGARGFNDGLYYDASAVNTDQLRRVFKDIFTKMNQEQHYNMMMSRK